jgi:adenylyltransferase/sulfurtransferase
LLFRQADLGRPKLEAARDTLLGLNPHTQVTLHDAWLTRDNALDILGGYDVVINGCDNFPTRYLVNDACVLLGKPCVDGSIYRFEGQVTVYDTAAGGPCYRCRFPQPPPPGSVPSCAEAGVFGVLPGIVGTLQAAETLKLIWRRAGVLDSELLLGRVLVVDVLGAEFIEFRLKRNADCPVCGDSPTVTELVDYDAFCSGHGAGAVEPKDITQRLACDCQAYEVSPRELHERLAGGEPPLLLDVREPWEHALARIDGSLLMPLGEVAERAAELPLDRPIVTVCHHGVRSLDAVARLHQAGLPGAVSLRGGIDAWSREVDGSVPRY